MYELGYRTRKRPYKLITTLLGLLIIVGCTVAYKAFHLTAVPQSRIQNGAAHTVNYQPETAGQIQIDKPLFLLKLPAGWGETTDLKQKFSAVGYNFHSSSADARQLAVYIDDAPATLTINRALAVTAKGNRLTYGTVSDNCTTFTAANQPEPGSGRATGLWQGASFICDLGNYERNVVGTVSTDGLNYINLTGPVAGKHRVFITYADNGASPNFGVLYAILNSFELK